MKNVKLVNYDVYDIYPSNIHTHPPPLSQSREKSRITILRKYAMNIKRLLGARWNIYGGIIPPIDAFLPLKIRDIGPKRAVFR